MFEKILLSAIERLIVNPSLALPYLEGKPSPFLKFFDIDKVRAYLLRQLIERIYSASTFYREGLERAGVRPEDIKGVQDLESLPFTYPDDILKNADSMLCVGQEDVVALFTSSGTTGEEKKIRQIGLAALGMLAAGFRRHERVYITLSYGRPSWAVGYILQRAFEHIGAFVIPMGDGAPVDMHEKYLATFKPTLIIGTPSYIMRLTESLNGKINLAQIGVRKLLLVAEPFPESFRSHLAQCWNAEVFDGYGLAELGFTFAMECSAHQGLHYNELDVLLEVVDPQTGEPLPPGEVGELVFTTLTREAMPLLRYRSRDLACILPQPCPCGYPVARISRILGRCDDMVILGSGENYYPKMFDEAVFAVPDVKDYRLIVERKGARDIITLLIVAPEGKEEDVRKALLKIDRLRNDVENTGCLEIYPA